MADLVLNVNSTINCPHGGKVSIMTSNTRVKVGGAAAVTVSDTYTISGCPFQIPVGAGTKPQPCVKAQWMVPAKHVKVMSNFVLTAASSGVCQSAEQAPQGPPQVVQTQMRVKAT